MLGFVIFAYLVVGTVYWMWLKAGYEDRHGDIQMRQNLFLYGRAMGWPWDLARVIYYAVRGPSS